MTEAKTGGLYDALAQLQARLPVVGKNKTGKVQGKEGKQGYTYDYADLTDVTVALAPLLGKLGLAFTSKPTINAEGQFVLAYKLVHVSGETDEGQYLLPSPERVSPQQLGSFITYARRYSLCAVTGLAPGGDDDDGQSAQGATTGEDDWRSAPPVQRRQERSPEIPVAAPAEPVTDVDWMSRLVDDLIPAAKDADKLNDYWADVNQQVSDGKCTPEHEKEIKAFIRERGRELGLGNKGNGNAAEPAEVTA